MEGSLPTSDGPVGSGLRRYRLRGGAPCGRRPAEVKLAQPLDVLSPLPQHQRQIDPLIGDRDCPITPKPAAEGITLDG
jgi:hypothetical protein